MSDRESVATMNQELQWPLKVLVNAADSNFTGIAFSDVQATLAFIQEKLVRKELFFLDHAGNDKVVVAVQPISEKCAELHIVSIDNSYGLITEIRRLFKKNRQYCPHKLVVKVTDETFFPLLNRLGWTHEATIREYGPEGKDLYYWSLIVERTH